MNTKEIYSKPEIEIIELELTSIIANSPGGANLGGNGNAGDGSSAYSKRRFGWED